MESDRIQRLSLDRAYFTRRASEERLAAEKAANRKASEAHLQMAERYEAQALAANADQQPPSPSAIAEESVQ